MASQESLELVIFDQQSAATSLLASLPLTRHVDGLIVMSLPLSDEIVQRLTRRAIPTVLIELGHPGFSSVTVDDRAGGRMIADLFIAKGHQRCGYLGHAQTSTYLSQSNLRLEGFTSGLPAPPTLRLVEHTLAAAHSAALELLGHVDRPRAIFAHDDVLASGVLLAARQLGLSVPHDLAVAGFDDSEMAEALGLTTVRQPLEESGEIAMQVLLAQLANPGAAIRNTALGLSLVERETT